MRNWNRREFIKWGGGALLGSMLPLSNLLAAVERSNPDRQIAFYNIHTCEKLCVCYYAEGDYQPEALTRIDYILRDHRTDEVKVIDPQLLDLLYSISARVHTDGPFNVISGYRSIKTNEKLRRCTKGVAKKSLHTQGQAIDIRLPGYSTRRLRDLCVNLRAGGVGYYPESDFVHIDIGRVRTW